MTGVDTIGKVSPEEVVVSRAGTQEIIKNLPPLPKPDYWGQCGEASISLFTVPLIIGALICAVYFLTKSPDVPEVVQLSCLSVVALESLVGILCLLALLLGDPGIIRRNAENCKSMPHVVLERLAQKETQPSHNIRGSDDSSFCVRCFVWRTPSMATRRLPFSERVSRYIPTFGIIEEVYSGAHHCSTCQRCVRDFHHHCGFYGRCIARGNMVYFKMIINLGFLGIATCLAVVPIALAYRSGAMASILSAVGIITLSVVGIAFIYIFN